MKRATTLKLPKTTSNKRVDPDNPPWSEEMLGPPVLKRGRGYQTQINDELRKVVAKRLTSSSRRTQKRAA